MHFVRPVLNPRGILTGPQRWTGVWANKTRSINKLYWGKEKNDKVIYLGGFSATQQCHSFSLGTSCIVSVILWRQNSLWNIEGTFNFIALFWPRNFSKLLQKKIFVHNFKKIHQHFQTHIHFFFFQKHKTFSSDQDRGSFHYPCLGHTMEVT